MNLRKPILFVTLALTLGTSALLPAQVRPADLRATNDTGIQPYGSYSGTKENIGLANGNLNLSIPLVSLPQRNGRNFSLALTYDSKIWNPVNTFLEGSSAYSVYWRYEDRGPKVGTVGWMLNIPNITGGVGIWGGDGIVGYNDLIVTLPDGGKHAVAHPAMSPTGTMNAEDGSSMTASVETYPWSDNGPIIVRTKDGTTLRFPTPNSYVDKIVDTNGNVISFSYSSGGIDITDTVGRTINVVYSNGFPTSIIYKDSTGTPQSVTFNYSAPTLNPTFQNPVTCANTGQKRCTPEMYVYQPGSSPYRLLSSVTLPEDVSGNHTYRFFYTAYDINDNLNPAAFNQYGELTAIIYPTGGGTLYTYQRLSHSEAYWQDSGNFETTDFREIKTKQVCKGSLNPTTLACSGTAMEITRYTPTVNGSANGTVVETGPDSVVTTYTFSPGSVFPTDSRYVTPHELTRTITKSGVQYQKVTTSYSGGIPQFPSSIVTQTGNAYVKQEFDYYTFTADVVMGYGYQGDPAYPVYPSYFQQTRTIDNVQEKREYDVSTLPTSFTLLRKTGYTYLTYAWLNIRDRKASETVYDPDGTPKARTNYGYDAGGLTATSVTVQVQSAPTFRGNITSQTLCLDPVSCTSDLTTTYTYDDLGHLRTVTDPKLNVTTFTYADSWSNSGCQPSSESNAFLTTIHNATGHNTTATYNSCTGTIASITDPNGVPTTYPTYDSLNRLRVTSFADGGQITLGYTEPSGGPFSLSSTTKITSSMNLVSTGTLDYLGRAKSSCLADPEGDDCTETEYDQAGQVSSKSNLHRTGGLPTDGRTTYTYDPLDRVLTSTALNASLQSMGAIQTVYSDNCTTVTDEAGKKRKSCVDGLGRLTSVYEDPDSLNYLTKYTYDALGSLTCVEQHGNVASATGCSTAGYTGGPWRVRRFTYDALSRLTQARNPESGVITYSYPLPGSLCSGDPSAVCTKTDARGTTITFTYNDPLNRLTGKTYSTGDPAVTYGYDAYVPGTNYGRGRRTSMMVGSNANSAAWVYDIRGRAHVVNRTANGISKSMTYGYNLDGSVASIVYPSNRTVNYTSNPAGRAILAHDVVLNLDLVNTVSYTPSGALSSGKLGANITLTSTYNSRLQPNRLFAVGGTTLMDRIYDFHDVTGDNGNVWGITDGLDDPNSTTRPVGSAMLTYDSLNRIAGFMTSGTTCTSIPGQIPGSRNSGNTYTIDAWGNLTNKTVSKCTAETLNEPIDSTNPINRFIPATPANPVSTGRYDAAGNMVQFGAYTYDAESRIITGGGYTYSYDGDGNRVSKTGPANELHWFGADSETLAESDTSGSITAEYIYFGGKRVARIDMADSTHPIYYISDHLGSATVLANANGTSRGETMYFPYGGERWSSVADSNHYKFTGKERDSETGLDYFGARYYGSNMGRFMSPDWSANPSPVPYAKFDDPQTLNLYSYVRNNPLNRFDVDGHCDSSDKATAKTKCQDTKNLKVNDAGLKHIEKSEGLKEKAYLDTGKKLTVGYGHLVTEKDGIKLGDKITKEKAEEFLKTDIASAEKAVKDAAGSLQLSQGEFNALSDAAYNVGPGVFTTDKSPSLMGAMGKGDYKGMSEQLRYTKDALGASQPGLATRSDERKQIFLGTDSD